MKTTRSFTRGRKPIEKNVVVKDAFGLPLQATYFRRAKQLVKKGRAEWIDGNVIRLFAGPPYDQDYEEDLSMENNSNDRSGAMPKIDALSAAAAIKKTETEQHETEKPETGRTVSARGISAMEERYLALLNQLAEADEVAKDALRAAENIAEQNAKAETIQKVVAFYEESKRRMAAQILRALDSGPGTNEALKKVGKFRDGRVHKKILEYYENYPNAEEEIGVPDTRTGSEYVESYGGGNTQHFHCGNQGQCKIMASSHGTYLLGGVFHQHWWYSGHRNKVGETPVSDVYEDEDGMLCQDFERGRMVYDPDTYHMEAVRYDDGRRDFRKHGSGRNRNPFVDMRGMGEMGDMFNNLGDEIRRQVQASLESALRGIKPLDVHDGPRPN